MALRTGDTYDVFLSHASEDKQDVVDPLAAELTKRGIRVWLDSQQLTLGDSLGQKIDEGLAQSRFGAVVLSPSFFSKDWPQRELDGLVARETAFGFKVILPIWHDIGRDEIVQYSPTLAGKLAARTADGISAVADQIAEVLSGPVDAGQLVTGGADQSTTRTDANPGRPRGEDSSKSQSTGALVRAAVLDQRLPAVRALIAQRTAQAERALLAGVPTAFAEALESLASISGALALLAPADAVTNFALTGPHRIFDAAQNSSSAWQIAEPISASWPAMLAGVRALGALLIRLELWSEIRTLADHPPPPDGAKIYPGWLTWMEVQIARRRQMPSNAEHYRQPLRDAVDIVQRIEELRPDDPDTNTTLNSVIAFDFLSRVVQADAALSAGRPTESYPNFAHFDSRAVRPFARRLVMSGAITSQLLPTRTPEDVLVVLGVVESQAMTATQGRGFWDGIADRDLLPAITTAYAQSGLADST
jgi:hypothetical protein